MEHKDDGNDILKQHFDAQETDFDKELDARCRNQSFSDMRIIPVPKSIAAQEMFHSQKSEAKPVNAEDILESSSSSEETKEIVPSTEASSVPDAVESIAEVDKAQTETPPEVPQENRLRRRFVAPKPVVEFQVPKSDPNFTKRIIEEQTKVSHVRQSDSPAFPLKYVTEETKPLSPSESDDLNTVFGNEKGFLLAECKDDIDKVLERIKVNTRLMAKTKMMLSADEDYRNEIIGKMNAEDKKIARAKMGEGYISRRGPKKSVYKKPTEAICNSIQALKDIKQTAEQIKARFMVKNMLTADISHYIDKLFSQTASTPEPETV
jgi:hypothetical protein